MDINEGLWVLHGYFQSINFNAQLSKYKILYHETEGAGIECNAYNTIIQFEGYGMPCATWTLHNRHVIVHSHIYTRYLSLKGRLCDDIKKN